MTLNRYRLRHLAKAQHPGAIRAQALLKQPDRLIGLILLGNNFVNILASSLATIIALRLLGEPGVAVAAGLLTLAVLIFAEVAPKTLAARYPEQVAFPAAFVYVPLLKVLYPLVWLVNLIANGLLRMIGVPFEGEETGALSSEELRTVVAEAGAMIPKRRQQMLLSILDLEKATVEDIMIPRNEIIGLNLNDSREEIQEHLANSQFTRIPVYEGSIDNIMGMLHARQAIHALLQSQADKETLKRYLMPPYFVPEGTPLNQQLLNFQRERQRVALVVDEYGEVQGLVTLDDLLEEIVGEFTTAPDDSVPEIHPQADGSYLVDGSASVRDINRALDLTLPTDGPKTLNGLIIEYLESIPEPGTSLLLAGHPVEIIQTKGTMVRTARIRPRLNP